MINFNVHNDWHCDDDDLQKGNTALHVASLAGQLEVVKILIENGADVNVQSQVNILRSFDDFNANGRLNFDRPH